MKRSLALALFSICLAIPAFAKGPELSSGFYLGPQFVYESSEYSVTLPLLGTTTYKNETRHTRLAFWGFLDARYALLTVGYTVFDGTGNTKLITTSESSTSENTGTTDFYANNIEVGLAAKYPFGLGRNLEAWPLFGLVYSINTGMTDKDDLTEEQKNDLNDLWLRVGAGLDWSVGKGFYLRLQADSLFNLTARPSDAPDSWSYMGVVVNMGLALGYRFQ